jgi:hypothetical protein
MRVGYWILVGGRKCRDSWNRINGPRLQIRRVVEGERIGFRHGVISRGKDRFLKEVSNPWSWCWLR